MLTYLFSSSAIKQLHHLLLLLPTKLYDYSNLYSNSWVQMYMDVYVCAYHINKGVWNFFSLCQQIQFMQTTEVCKANKNIQTQQSVLWSCVYVHTCIFCLGIIKILLSFESHVTYGCGSICVGLPECTKGNFILRFLLFSMRYVVAA